MSVPAGVEVSLYGEAPVQGDGRVDGHPFYFRARHEHWSFTICISHDIDPSEIPPPDNDGWFTWDEFVCYEVSGGYTKASRMPFEKAHELIAKCVAEFRKAIEDRNVDPSLPAP